MPVVHDTAEVFLSSDKRGSRPTQRHAAVLPVLDPVCAFSNAGVAVVDQICGSQTASQRGRQAETVDREHLGEAFPERCRRTRPIPLQPRSILFNFLDSFVCFEFPRRFQRRSGLVVLIFGEMAGHVSDLMIAATLDEVAFAEDLVDRLPQSFRAVDDEQSFAKR